MVRIERVYDYAKRQRGDGEVVILVDRLWPRGVRRETLDIDVWMKDIGPSDDLRRWFGHDPNKWTAFRARYGAEIRSDAGKRRLFDRLLELASGRLTLLYSARNEQFNQARALQEMLVERQAGKGPD